MKRSAAEANIHSPKLEKVKQSLPGTPNRRVSFSSAPDKVLTYRKQDVEKEN